MCPQQPLSSSRMSRIKASFFLVVPKTYSCPPVPSRTNGSWRSIVSIWNNTCNLQYFTPSPLYSRSAKSHVKNVFDARRGSGAERRYRLPTVRGEGQPISAYHPMDLWGNMLHNHKVYVYSIEFHLGPSDRAEEEHEPLCHRRHAHHSWRPGGQ